MAKDTDRDYYMTAEEAKEYGVVDEILIKRPTDDDDDDDDDDDKGYVVGKPSEN